MGFSLELPPEEVIKEQIKEEVTVNKQKKEHITEVAAVKAKEVLDVDLSSLSERREVIAVFEDFGKDIVAKSSQKNQLLQTRIGKLGHAGGQTGEIAKGLEELAVQMKDLDPSGLDFLKTGGMGWLFNPIRKYFAKFEKADSVISNIFKSLDKGERTLKNDNATLEIEQVSMRNLTIQLNEKIELGAQMDEQISTSIESASISNLENETIRFVEEEILLPLRQRVVDFQQMLAVNQQGIIAMEIIRKNNLELIRSVERAKTVTISALRIAVTIAQALYNQKLVLEKIQLLNAATNDMITSTSRLLKEQGVEIQKKAVEANISVETMQQAFTDTFAALDDISNYRQSALPRVQSMIAAFQQMTDDGEKVLQRMEEAEKRRTCL